MVEPVRRNGAKESQPRITSVPDVDEWVEFQRQVDERKAQQDQAIGGAFRLVVKHWKTAMLLAGGAIGFWQWLESQAVAGVLADQAQKHQTAEVELNSTHRAKSTAAEAATTKAVGANTRAIANNAKSIQTVLEVNLANPRTRNAVKRNEQLANKAKRVLGLLPSDDL